MFTSPTYFWLIAGLLLLLAELLTPGFVVACFGLGALLAILPAALGASLTWQVITFCIGSIVALILLRPMLRRLDRHKKPTSTGVAALYGRTARVTECIDASRGSGRIAVDGDSWQARTESPDIVIPRGETVRIISNDSIIMIVEPVSQTTD